MFTTTIVFVSTFVLRTYVLRCVVNLQDVVKWVQCHSGLVWGCGQSGRSLWLQQDETRCIAVLLRTIHTQRDDDILSRVRNLSMVFRITFKVGCFSRITVEDYRP